MFENDCKLPEFRYLNMRFELLAKFSKMEYYMMENGLS
jgi:hypothetical protein